MTYGITTTHIPTAVLEWVIGDDTGISSITIWSVMLGLKYEGNVPRDSHDFGRCYRLLQLMPEWKSRLSELVDHDERWKPFVDNWDEMTQIWEDTSSIPDGSKYPYSHQLYEFMKQFQSQLGTNNLQHQT